MPQTERSTISTASTQLTCPVCDRDVANHTEQESVTCVNVSKINPTKPIRDTIAQSKGCSQCDEQEAAITQLWSRIHGRAHPTRFAWHCTSCNNERELTIN